MLAFAAILSAGKCETAQIHSSGVSGSYRSIMARHGALYKILEAEAKHFNREVKQ
jgi:hypothetical protein